MIILHKFIPYHLMNRAVAVLASVSLTFSPLAAYANPQGGTVAAGQAAISESGSKLDVHQSTDKAVIDWRSFDIQAGEHTQFHQPSAASMTLNRVNNANPSQIMGQMSANGHVILVNPNGVFFGGNSKIDVNGLVATTANIGNSDFMAGKLHFNAPGNPQGSIVNQGTITAGELGLVGLVAPSVENNGIIKARLGTVTLASGDSFTLDMAGDNLIKVEVRGELSKQIAQNRGRIDAEGGVITLTAAAARNTVNGVVSNSGTLNANAFKQKDGKIILYAVGSNAVKGKSGSSTALNSGTITAIGDKGGKVEVLGDHVGLLSGSRIDVSGKHGGGTAHIGGDYQGKSTTPTARRTVIQSNTVIKADAVENGNGGRVIAWADERTDFGGNISARGGIWGGDGGFVETSGKQLLSVSGVVDSSSPRGKAGLWLLDPNNVTIQTAGVETNVSATPNFTTTDDTAIVTTGSIETALNAGTSVTVMTSTSGANTQLGDITVSNAIAKTAGADATLTLKAHGSIIIGAAANISSNTNKLHVVLNSDSDANGAGAISMTSASITTNGGNITMGGGANPLTTAAYGTAVYASGITLTSSTLTSAGGDINLRGHGYNGAAATDQYGVLLDASTATTTSGTLTAVGVGGAGTSYNHGVHVKAVGKLVTGSGNLSVTGTGGAVSTANGNTDNYGVFVTAANSQIISTSGVMTINGTGGNGDDYGFGIRVATSGNITTGSGNLSLYGTGSSTNYNYGIITDNSATINTTGSGNLRLEGTGLRAIEMTTSSIISSSGSGTVTLIGAGVIDGIAVHVQNSSVTTVNSDLLIQGTTATDGWGVECNNCTLRSTGTGNMTINGTLNNANGGGNDWGVLFYNGTINTNSGNLTLIGTVNSAGTTAAHRDMYGIVWGGAATVSSTSGTMTVNGTGGDGSTNNYGIYMNSNGTISTGSGNLTITATGGNGNSTGNYGLFLNGTIRSTGAGAITINATGKNSAVDIFNSAVYTLGRAAATGTITLVQDSATWGSLIVNTSGGIVIKPRSAATTIGVAGGAGTLGVTSAFLTAMLRSSGVTIGDTAASGLVTVNAYTWARGLTLQTATGGITFNGVTDMQANTLLARTHGLSDITIDAASSITTSAAGNALTLASGRNFINNSNGAALTTSVGRSLIYSTTPASDTLGGLARPTKRYNKTYAAYAPGSVVETGNVFLYSVAPTVTVTAGNATKTVGDALPSFSVSYSGGYIDGDTAADAYSGAASFTTTALAGSGVGTYAITPTVGTLASTLGYQFAYVDGTLTVYAAASGSTPPASSGFVFTVPDDPVVPVTSGGSTPTGTATTTTTEEPVSTPAVTKTVAVPEGLRTAIAAIESTTRFAQINAFTYPHAAVAMTRFEPRLAVEAAGNSRLNFAMITLSPELQRKLKIILPSLITTSTEKTLIKH